jgi:hypothetical protein
VAVESSSFFFSAQTTNTEENILKLTKSEAERIVSRKNLGESKLQKRLSENKEKAQKNRFTIVNYTRSSSKFPEEINDEELTIVDVERDKVEPPAAAAPSAEIKCAESEYVYDIYIAEKTPATILNSEPFDINDLSIMDYNDYLYSCPRLTNDSDESGEESSDSNDENYYTNDYPDEEDGNSDDNESIGEREMRRAMRNFGMENELSSDEEQDFVYSVDAEGVEFEDDVDFAADVARYGRSYAKYKKKVLREMDDDDCQSSAEVDDDD